MRGPYDVTLCSLPEGSEATYVDVHRADSHLSNPLSKLSMAFSKDGHGSLAYSDFTRTGERSIADALRSCKQDALVNRIMCSRLLRFHYPSCNLRLEHSTGWAVDGVKPET